ncbi:MAG: thrombospondin type 3 repeat-containing protein, partial [Limisphaerales bacterium]
GNINSVRIGSNASGQPSGEVIVVADAIRFTYSMEQEFPANGIIPLWWSLAHFGFQVDPSMDDDADGYTNAEEYILGTSPTTAGSSFQVNVFRSGGTANIMFHPFHANRRYSLQQRSSLQHSTWQTIATDTITVSPDGHGVFSLPLDNTAQVFYRIVVEFDPTPASASAQRSAVQERRMFVGEFAEPSCGPARIYAE